MNRCRLRRISRAQPCSSLLHCLRSRTKTHIGCLASGFIQQYSIPGLFPHPPFPHNHSPPFTIRDKIKAIGRKRDSAHVVYHCSLSEILELTCVLTSRGHGWLHRSVQWYRLSRMPHFRLLHELGRPSQLLHFISDSRVVCNTAGIGGVPSPLRSIASGCRDELTRRLPLAAKC